jgi:phospholipase A1
MIRVRWATHRKCAGAFGTMAAVIASPAVAWQTCATLPDADARLACYDQWAATQVPASGTGWGAATPAMPLSAETTVAGDAPALDKAVEFSDGCRNPAHGFADRFWELSEQTDCGTFRFRGYRPLSLALSMADRVNTSPSSPSAGRSATGVVDYRSTEMRMALSVRTKIATGLLPTTDPKAKDSLWFAYSQQSHWQLFSSAISRPFRNTDHEPELIYVYPLVAKLPLGGQLRYAGASAVHHSNGQSQPLSRSWNRSYLMLGAEWHDRWWLQARLWARVPERAEDDDNPDITRRMGRTEWRLLWEANPNHAFGLTWRHPLSPSPGGSVSVDWYRSLGGAGRGSLRLHTRLFSGYGESLIDYNFHRTTLSVGLSLLDF